MDSSNRACAEDQSPDTDTHIKCLPFSWKLYGTEFCTEGLAWMLDWAQLITAHCPVGCIYPEWPTFEIKSLNLGPTELSKT